MKKFYLSEGSLSGAAAGLALLVSGLCANAQINYYESNAQGYITNTLRTKAGVVAMSNRGNDISLISDNGLTTLVSGPGAGRYVNVSPDGKYLGFKSIDNDGLQAPALLDVETGKVTLLEPYADQCGQVSFGSDNTIAYTVGNTLYIVNKEAKKSYDLGSYVNIANINRDNSKVAYSSLDGYCHVLDLASGKTETMAVDNGYMPVWSPDNNKLAIHRINGELATIELNQNQVYELGEVTTFAWENDSEGLVVTRSQRANDFKVESASVSRIDFRGIESTDIVQPDAAVPVSASVSGRDIVVSYAGGNRKVECLSYSGGKYNAAPARRSELFAAGKNDNIGVIATAFGGARREDINEEAIRAAKSVSRATTEENSIGLLDIPYINQLWDTPWVPLGNGNVNYGYNCCASTTSCMLLGYYGLLPDDPSKYISNPGKPSGAVQVTKYAWYVGLEYTSPSTGHVFNESIDDGGYWGMTYGIKGGHAYLWYGDRQPNNAMDDFHMLNGADNAVIETANIVSMKNECRANRPYAICLQCGTGGHVVLAFRADQKAKPDGSGTVKAIGSFVCHDPAGDYNYGYYNWDGRYSSYDLPGINNGCANIGQFYWGVKTSASAGIEDITTDKPSFRVHTEPGRIIVDGSYDNVKVYDVYGRMIPSLEVSAGVYLVSVDGETQKVLVP